MRPPPHSRRAARHRQTVRRKTSRARHRAGLVGVRTVLLADESQPVRVVRRIALAPPVAIRLMARVVFHPVLGLSVGANSGLTRQGDRPGLELVVDGQVDKFGERTADGPTLVVPADLGARHGAIACRGWRLPVLVVPGWQSLAG